MRVQTWALHRGTTRFLGCIAQGGHEVTKKGSRERTEGGLSPHMWPTRVQSPTCPMVLRSPTGMMPEPRARRKT